MNTSLIPNFLLSKALSLGERRIFQDADLAAFIIGKDVAEASAEDFVASLSAFDSYDWNNLENQLIVKIRQILKDEMKEHSIVDLNISEVENLRDKLATLFLHFSAKYSVPAKYALAILPSQVLEDLVLEKSASEYYFEALIEDHWEAIRDIQFMGVVDVGLVDFINNIYNNSNDDCNSILSATQKLLSSLKFPAEDLPPVPNEMTPDQKRREFYNTIFTKVQAIMRPNGSKSLIEYHYEDIIYSKLALAAFLRQVDASDSQDGTKDLIQIYKPGLIYEDEVKKAESFIEKIQNSDLRKYVYLKLAKSAAIYNPLTRDSAHENVDSYTSAHEKVVKHFVKKADKIPEFAYYLLIKGAVEKIVDSDTSPQDREAYENKIREYLSKIGPLGNLAMFEIQKKNLSLQLREFERDPNAANEIIKEFKASIESWNQYFEKNDQAKFINEILIPTFLDWSFSESYIKRNLFIHKFFYETLTEELRKDMLPTIKDALKRQFNTHFSLSIKPKLTLKLKRKRQFKQFEKSLASEDPSLGSLPNYSPLVKTISNDTLHLLEELCGNIVDYLGNPPTDFQVFTLGSLARRESGFYTDFEIGIALQKNSIAAQIYFEKFSQKLADSLFMLEEHPDVGMHGAHLDTADNAPPHKRFEFRDFVDEQIMKQIRQAMGYRRKDDIPTAGSRIYLLAAEDFAKLFQHGILENSDPVTTFELSIFHTALLKEIMEKLSNCITIFNKNQNGNGQALKDFVDNVFKNTPDFALGNLADGELKNDLNTLISYFRNPLDPDSDTKIIACIESIPTLSTDLQNCLFKLLALPNLQETTFLDSELLRLAKKEIKNQLVEEYILSKNPTSTERFRLSKEALPHVKKILNPLTPREVGVARSVPELGRNLDIVYTHKSSDSALFDLLKARNQFFDQTIPSHDLSIHSGSLKQGQFISFRAMIDLLNNKVSSQKLFTDTFDLSLDPKLPSKEAKQLNKATAKMLPKKIDLKRAFYRIPEQILTGLSWFFRTKIAEEAQNPPEPDTFQHYLSIIDLLRKAGVFSERLALEFRFLMNLGVKFRLQQQMKLKGECNEVYFHEETWRKELADQDSKIKILQKSFDRWAFLYRQSASLENQNNFTDVLKNYLDALKKKAYLEKVGPDLFSVEEKILFAKGYHSLEHVVKLTEKWIKQVSTGKFDFPNPRL